jgi:hypothetical protein
MRADTVSSRGFLTHHRRAHVGVQRSMPKHAGLSFAALSDDTSALQKI